MVKLALKHASTVTIIYPKGIMTLKVGILLTWWYDFTCYFSKVYKLFVKDLKKNYLIYRKSILRMPILNFFELILQRRDWSKYCQNMCRSKIDHDSIVTETNSLVTFLLNTKSALDKNRLARLYKTTTHIVQGFPILG